MRQKDAHGWNNLGKTDSLKTSTLHGSSVCPSVETQPCKARHTHEAGIRSMHINGCTEVAGVQKVSCSSSKGLRLRLACRGCSA